MPDMPKYSIAVTIIGVIQLAGKVTSLGYGYIGGVDRAPKYLRELVDELAALSKVLIAIQDHTDKEPTSEVIHSLNEERGPLQGCARELEILQSELEPKNGEGLQSVMEDNLEWPLEEEPTKEYIKRVKALKEIFELSLQPESERIAGDLVGLVKKYTEDEDLEVHKLPLDHPVVVNWYKREEALRMEEKRENVLNWLYPEDPEARHNEISNRRQRETGSWLTERPEFREWLLHHDPASLFLWGYGIPGAGKTYLSSVVVDYFPSGPLAETQGKSKEKIIEALAMCAGEMILLVRFHLEYICQQTTAKQILQALTKLKGIIDREGPLEPTFIRAIENLRRQPKNCSDLAVKVLVWLAKTRRTLTVDEIQVAVSIEARRERLDELDLPDRTTLFDVCGSLVSIDEQSGTIRLSHESVNHFLANSPSTVPELLDETVTVALMTYLGFESLSIKITNDELPARLKEQPFLSYVVTQIQYHLKLCPEEITLQLVLRFLGMPVNIYSYLQAASFCNAKMRGDILIPEFPSEPLEYPDFPTKPALHVAVILGHFLAIKHLIKNGADLLERDSWGQTVIHEAVLAGNENVFCYLLEKGVDVLRADDKDQTALQRACDIGNERMVNLLLEKGAEVKTVDVTGKNCLHKAALGGHEGIVKILLERGIDFTVIDERGHNPLMEAASGGHEGIVKILLEKGADTSLLDVNCRSIIHLASHDGHHNVVRVLLENGVYDLSLFDKSGQTALHIAAARGHKSTLEVLVEHGADIHGKTSAGDSALHRAAIYGQRTIAMYLIGEGHVDISVLDANNRTALEVAEIARRDQLAMVLKGNGAEEEIKEAINRERLVQVLRGNLNPENPDERRLRTILDSFGSLDIMYAYRMGVIK
ncbi:uncharacterized protein LAJ45_02400 [Morchella importuna]|uniref:uncharacterized protein n=1 Tax=Morchella importuna TaxID=1174673 RepID=UPI001E8E10B2|nr:uncharacterized protein LAJ45_02400 [Morchella importuna]KAH8153587.1 hypothetical protein LAJ45_02400 [Morchella importuna]